MMPEQPRRRAVSTARAATDLELKIATPDTDGVMQVTANGIAVGEIIKSTPRIWNIAQNRSDVATFHEAINTNGEFLDPVFPTAEAAAAALAKRGGIRPSS
jgi:hypothetical protein